MMNRKNPVRESGSQGIGWDEHLTPALSPSAPLTPPTRRGGNAPSVLTMVSAGVGRGSMREWFGGLVIAVLLLAVGAGGAGDE